MSWNVILYILAALFVLPRVLWLVARKIHAYTHPNSAAAKPARGRRQSAKLGVPEMS